MDAARLAAEEAASADVCEDEDWDAAAAIAAAPPEEDAAAAAADMAL